MRPIRIFLQGLGSMGSLMARILDAKEGVEIVGAADSHPVKVGKTLGELFDLKRFSDVVVMDGVSAPLPEADVALLAVSSFIRGTEGYIRELVESGKNVITIAVNMIPEVLKARSGVVSMPELPVPSARLSDFRSFLSPDINTQHKD
ncbi:MAG: hypothetical protein CVV55_03480 [Synergistetes bacterium HGW-Synergistetes-2]|nr:MAG: hypothetical protein CVV55_03480 [Synergistetes bacterium HGW-Synergistetes-2]